MPPIDRLGFAPDKVTDALLRLNTPEPLAGTTPIAALGLMTSPAVPPAPVMLALILMLFEAVSVSVVLAFHAIGALTFKLPSPAPAVLLVCSKTLVPAFNAVSTSVLSTMLPPEFEVHVPAGDCAAVVVALLTVKSVGSSSQVPAAPCGAEAFIAMPATSSLWPDVSIVPPFPKPAPLAPSRPLTAVTPSDHTTIVPPFPFCVASALRVASDEMLTVSAWARGPVPC